MNSKVDLWIEQHSEDMIKDLQKLVSFKSVSHAELAQPGAPFGAECKKALEHILGICHGFGFADTDMDGYIGYADYGTGDETLGVLTHLDVVPEGEGWSSDPFAANIIDGTMIGRGVLDDKGPAITAVYALAAIKAAGLPFKRKVRLLFGCDEEVGMGCLKHYIANEKLPDMAFSPDAEYPLVNAEKNIFQARYAKKYSSGITLKAGTVVNAVPGKAVATVPCCPKCVEKAIKGQEGFAVEAIEGGSRITATGVAAHASMPENGKNAIQMLLGLLTKLELSEEDGLAVEGLYKTFKMEVHGETVGLDSADESGRLTLNLGLMDWNEKGYALSIDIRAPMCTGHEKLLQKLDAAFDKLGAHREYESFSLGYCVPEDSELVSKLLSAYRERTGDHNPPKRIGGGTYARHLKNAVAFGPERDDRENCIHMVDEAVPVKDLIENAKLVADGIMALCCK